MCEYNKTSTFEDIDYEKEYPYEIKNDYWKYNHLIVNGPDGVGKTSFVNNLIKDIYHINKLNIWNFEYMLNNYSNHSKNISVQTSDVHLNINPWNSGLDKHIIYEIINWYNTNKKITNNKINKFNTIVIDNIHNLSFFAQSSLRFIIDSNSWFCFFIFICSDIDKIIGAIKSRCQIIDLSYWIKIIEYLYNNCNVNVINYNILFISSKLFNECWQKIITLFDVVNQKIKYIVDLMMSVVNWNNANDEREIIIHIRKKIYDIYVWNIPYWFVIEKIYENITLNSVLLFRSLELPMKGDHWRSTCCGFIDLQLKIINTFQKFNAWWVNIKEYFYVLFIIINKLLLIFSNKKIE